MGELFRESSPGERQTGLSAKEGEFRIPDSLLAEYPTITGYLGGQDKWNRRVRGGMNVSSVLIRLSEDGRGTATVFNPHNWQVEERVTLEAFRPDSSLVGALIFSSKDNLRGIKEQTEGLFSVLPPNSPVYVFEEKVEDRSEEALKRRRRLLGESGLVERKTFRQPGSRRKAPINKLLVSRSRTPREHRGGKPRNLVDEGPVWSRKRTKEAVNEGARDYRRKGIIPLDAYDIGERLRKTIYAQDDLDRARLGFGFEIRLGCGCEGKVDVRGDWVPGITCDDWPNCGEE